MTLLTVLRKDKMQALKEKDTIRNGVCSLLISAIGLATKEKGEDLSEEEALKFVQRELKQEKDSLSQTPIERIDLIEASKKKIEIIEGYLPKQLTHDEIKTAILSILEEKNLEKSNKSKGIIMKEMMAAYAGKTDGKSVNAVLSDLLK